MPGRMLSGRYQVQDKIGTGGMATVYRGQDQVLGRTVAIKMMLPQYANDPSFAARFKQEAQAAAALSSPYIVSIYDWGKDGESYYIVMEYLRGTDLKSGIRKHGALDSRKVAQIGSQIAQALSVAHRHDIIHRDIKPQNIMVQPDGNIKVMDFGIARAKNSSLTTDNSVLGTAHYVSPEQSTGKPLGPTTDIYSLGIVMYEAATGRVPFVGDDAISVAMKQVNEAPQPPSLINPNVDPALEAIILRCMEKNPADRYQSADELARALRDFIAGRATIPSNTTVSPRIVTPPQPTSRLDRRGIDGSNTYITRGGDTGRLNRVHSREEADELDRRENKRRKRNVILGVLGALVVLALAGFAIAQMLGNSAQQYLVPQFVGQTKDQATQALNASDSHFKLGTVTESYSDSAPEGQVIDQTPSANKQAPEGTAVNLVISKGAKPAAAVKVPDLTNKSPSEAESALAAVGLKARNGDSVESDDVTVGYVATQEPAAGSDAKAGDTITYHLSTGKGKADVPDVTEMTAERASDVLKDAGFKVDTQKQPSSSVPEGRVISQSPTNGKADKGSTVTIVVSSGAQSGSVPNVVGKDFETAQSTLENAGFQVNTVWVYDDNVATGNVVGQTPSSAAAGATITIRVSSGPRPSA